MPARLNPIQIYRNIVSLGGAFSKKAPDTLIQDWLIERLVAMERVLRPRVRTLP